TSPSKETSPSKDGVHATLPSTCWIPQGSCWHRGGAGKEFSIGSTQSSRRNHGHNDDRHGSDRRSGGGNHRSNNDYSGNDKLNFFKSMQLLCIHEHDPNTTS
nr:hypothetical protein [Tanacetum cinerariifolium]